MSRRNCVRVDYPDDDLRDRVAHFLGSRHFHNLARISVAVENGRVTLQGIVGSFYEKQVALSTCQRVAGVLSMVDMLEVSDDSAEYELESGIRALVGQCNVTARY